jgi:hypothetical protein
VEGTGSGYVQCRALIFEVLNLHILETKYLNCFWYSPHTQNPTYGRTQRFNFNISENFMYDPLGKNPVSEEPTM